MTRKVREIFSFSSFSPSFSYCNYRVSLLFLCGLVSNLFFSDVCSILMGYEGRESPIFEEHDGAGSAFGNKIPHFDIILAHIRQACQIAAYTNAADPIAFVANCLRTAADRRDKAEHSLQKQKSEDAELAAVRDAQELARQQMVRGTGGVD